jgi:peptidoglycan/xylan/chitin deacetylase (PgdA/CDA1 family)
MTTTLTQRAAPAAGGALDIALRTAFGALSREGPAARLQILIFHRVVPESDPLFPEEVDRREFDAICGWLARWTNVLPLDQAAERLARGTLPARAAVITFDDGYADNHDVALPVLRAHGLPATFFIATDYLNGGRMWNDTVIEAVRGCRHGTLDLTSLGLEGVTALELAPVRARRAAIDRILGAAKYLPPPERLAKVHLVAELAGVVPPSNLMMTSEQVRSLARAGMQIGAHTASHPILARLPDAQAREEIARGKADLEALLGAPVTLFAYPNGRPGRDYIARDVQTVRELGFMVAVSTSPGAAGPRCAPLLQLPRFTPWDRRAGRFGARLLKNLFTRPVAV